MHALAGDPHSPDVMCDGVRLTDEDGNRLAVATCCDDFVLRETAGNDKKLTMRVLKAFADAMGSWDKVKYSDRPAAFKGYGISWSRDNTVCSLHMTAHVEALAHKYVPEVFEDRLPPDVLSGMKLCYAADALLMSSPRPLVLDSKAKETQAIGGGIKFIERGVMPRVSRLMHKLSCVQAAPGDHKEGCRCCRRAVAAK